MYKNVNSILVTLTMDANSDDDSQLKNNFDLCSFLPLRDAFLNRQKDLSSFSAVFKALTKSKSLSNPELNSAISSETFHFLVNHFDKSSVTTKDEPLQPKEPTITKSQETQTDAIEVDAKQIKTTRDLLDLFASTNGDEDIYCEIPPIPIARKANRKLSKRSVQSTSTCSSSSKCDNFSPEMEISEATSSSANPQEEQQQPDEAIYAASTFEDEENDIDEYDEFDCDDASSSNGYFVRDDLPRPPLPTNSKFVAFFKESKTSASSSGSGLKAPVSVKRRAKESFRQLMKINKMASNKLLSMRLRDAHGTLRKKIFSFSAFDGLHRPQQHKARRPTREPPPPPILIFRPAAPEPSAPTPGDDIYPNANSRKQPDDDTISELYHDAFHPEHTEGREEAIYSSVDEILAGKPDATETSNENGVKEESHYDENGANGSESTTGYDGVDYYDDGQCIYEELSSPDDDDDGTIYEDYFDDHEEQTYGNIEEIKVNQEQKEKEQAEAEMKRIKKLAKTMKKFHLQGDEVPINSGVIVSDRRGSRNNLLVRRGETVLIIRMDGNPPGKWLAKNERSKLGYIDPDNVIFETGSIAAVIKSFHNCNL